MKRNTIIIATLEKMTKEAYLFLMPISIHCAIESSGFVCQNTATPKAVCSWQT